MLLSPMQFATACSDVSLVADLASDVHGRFGGGVSELRRALFSVSCDCFRFRSSFGPRSGDFSEAGGF